MAATDTMGRATSSAKVSVVRFSLTGAIASGAFFILCWLGMFVPFGSPTHAYLRLFTNAELTTAFGFGQGLCWSVLFGAVAGGLIALIYNALKAFDGR